MVGAAADDPPALHVAALQANSSRARSRSVGAYTCASKKSGRPQSAHVGASAAATLPPPASAARCASPANATCGRGEAQAAGAT